MRGFVDFSFSVFKIFEKLAHNGRFYGSDHFIGQMVNLRLATHMFMNQNSYYLKRVEAVVKISGDICVEAVACNAFVVAGGVIVRRR